MTEITRRNSRPRPPPPGEKESCTMQAGFNSLNRQIQRIGNFSIGIAVEIAYENHFVDRPELVNCFSHNRLQLAVDQLLIKIFRPIDDRPDEMMPVLGEPRKVSLDVDRS